MTVQINNLYAKVDEIFGFNLSKTTEGVDYNFGQYRLNQLYKPLVKFFLKKFEESLNTYPTEEADKILTLFIDFFRLYFFQGDFGYFKNKYSSFTYKVPYARTTTGGDTDFWRATKDCYYVKTSDVENTMDIQIVDPDLSERPIRLQLFKKSKPDAQGNFTTLDIEIQEQRDPESDELLGYYITIYNRDETGAKASNKALIFKKIDELRIEKTPSLEARISDFLAKRGRDYFIHKRLKDFLSGELERYLFQALKSHPAERIALLQTQAQLQSSGVTETADFGLGLIQQLSEKSALSCYQAAYLWIQSFINILADLEDFKAKLWNKTRKVIQQDYCISVGKIKELELLIPRRDQLFSEILDNENQLQEWSNLLESGLFKTKITLDDIRKALENGNIESIKNLVVDTKFFQKDSEVYKSIEEWGSKKLYEEGANLDGIMIKSENYQGLGLLQQDYKNKIQGVYIDPPFNLGENGDFLYKTDYLDGSWASLLYDRYLRCSNLMTEDSSIFTRCDINGDDLIRHVSSTVFTRMCFHGKITLRKMNQQGENIKQFNQSTESLFHYGKNNISLFNHQYKERSKESKWINMHSPRQNKIEQTIKIMDRIFIAPMGRHWTFKQSRIPEMLSEGRIRINEEAVYIDVYGCQQKGMPQYLTSNKEILDSNWTDIGGYSSTTGFKTENAEIVLQRCILSISNQSDIFLDYFMGSATTQAVAQKLKRKWIGIEMGNQFERFDIKRMKEVLMGKESGISKEKDVEYSGGGFFTYIYLNQYQDRFDTGGYLDTLQDEITSFATSDDFEQTTHILAPLQQLKEKIYDLDDTLTIEQLREKSSMLR